MTNVRLQGNRVVDIGYDEFNWEFKMATKQRGSFTPSYFAIHSRVFASESGFQIENG